MPWAFRAELAQNLFASRLASGLQRDNWKKGKDPHPECTKIARFSAAAAAIFTAPQEIARFLEAPRCAIASAKKIASEPRFLLRRKWVKMVLAAEFPAIPSSAVKIASEQRCAILAHSAPHPQDKIQHLDFTKDPRLLYYKTPPCAFYHKNVRSKAVFGPW